MSETDDVRRLTAQSRARMEAVAALREQRQLIARHSARRLEESRRLLGRHVRAQRERDEV